MVIPNLSLSETSSVASTLAQSFGDIGTVTLIGKGGSSSSSRGDPSGSQMTTQPKNNVPLYVGGALVAVVAVSLILKKK